MFTIADNLIVRVKSTERTTKTGLIVGLKEPDLLTGVVEVTGPGKYFMDGSLVKGLVTKGDIVWFKRQVAIEMERQDEDTLYVVSESSLLAYEPANA